MTSKSATTQFIPLQAYALWQRLTHSTTQLHTIKMRSVTHRRPQKCVNFLPYWVKLSFKKSRSLISRKTKSVNDEDLMSHWHTCKYGDKTFPSITCTGIDKISEMGIKLLFAYLCSDYLTVRLRTEVPVQIDYGICTSQVAYVQFTGFRC